MSATQTILPAPILQEALDNVLHVGQLEGPAHAQVMVMPSAVTGATVDLSVKTSTGNEWQGSTVVVQVPGTLNFKVPKDVFEKGLTPGASAKLRYTLTNPGNSPVVSQELKIQLQE
ncbi:hypothetical protein GIW70_11535 [Pseudomonas syringae]|nr:hypothetical protein [Pseudomonas syringae]MCF5068815.1 hypothetical protein [Pseudomonas syringae]